jgi:hypothetical protein
MNASNDSFRGVNKKIGWLNGIKTDTHSRSETKAGDMPT